MDKILDVREMAPKDRHPRIFDAFKALGPGESFILINDHEPRPLLYQFQAEHDGEFEWWPLEQGPQAWRVVVAKREKMDMHRALTDFFQTDHRRLDAIFDRFKDAIRAKKFEEAASAFREFRLGLTRHIRAEEEILFPVFEDKTGMHDAGPTAVMRMDHKDIKELMDKIVNAADAKDEKTAVDSAQVIFNILADHNMKEEHILYPETDSFLSDAERSQVIKKAQTLP